LVADAAGGGEPGGVIEVGEFPRVAEGAVGGDEEAGGGVLVDEGLGVGDGGGAVADVGLLFGVVGEECCEGAIGAAEGEEAAGGFADGEVGVEFGGGVGAVFAGGEDDAAFVRGEGDDGDGPALGLDGVVC
jgi:hypothetical protein